MEIKQIEDNYNMGFITPKEYYTQTTHYYARVSNKKLNWIKWHIYCLIPSWIFNLIEKQNSIKLHSIAFVIILPCILTFSEDSLIINLVGILYMLLLFRLSYTKRGKRFIRSYYKEILWLETLL